MSAPSTLLVVSTDPATQGPCVLINAADFDPAVHTPYAAETPQDASPDTPAARTRRQPKQPTA